MIDPYGLNIAVNQLDPLDRLAPGNAGLVARYLCLPEGMGGPTWRDLIGNNPGTLNNMGAGYGWQPTTRPGGSGQLGFDGTGFGFGSYIGVADAPGLRLLTPFAVALWFRSAIAGNAYSASPSLLAKEDTPGGWNLRINAGVGRVEWVRDDATIPVFTSTTVAAGVWYRVLFTWDGSTLAAYVNGLADGSGSYSAATSTTAPLWIGADFKYPTRAFMGAIDGVLIAGRAFSAAEAWADYEDGRRGYPATLNRIGPSVFLMRTVGATGATAGFAATLGAVTMIGSASTTVPSTSASLVASLAGVNLAAVAGATAGASNATLAATLGNVTMIGSASTSFPSVHADLAITLAGATLAASASAGAPAGIHAALATALDGVTVGGSATAGSAAGTAIFAANLAGVTLSSAAGATIPPSAAGFAATLAGVTLGAAATWVSPGIHVALLAPLAGVTLGATAAHVGLPAVAAFGASLGGVTLASAVYHMPPAYRPVFAATLDGVLLGASAVSTGQAYAYFAAPLAGVGMVATARAVPMLRSAHFAGVLDGVELAAGVLVPYTVRRAPDPRMATSRRIGPDPETSTWTRAGG